ncbi:hypothetical protein Skr01_61860 [Sphaerisporangium krabiense]|uniref:Guanylate cyclase domain-containing protein n=1 Tax=Sphaerisporangium krabiense TaxID=763782 RepID=A0A7W8Z301_9ACTN|nr:hypothetical protein [Sphaerisporangium krabiense]MBB5626233.1 hypothetical protein [Sphaerisporangium krabiense]GII66101.1 hypothetical protein Skr01_61860 [Sphaerisporangium krabiense]
MRDEREFRLMITSDIEDYGGRSDGDQVELQQRLTRVLDLAAGAAGLAWLEWKQQPQGDGYFTVLPPGTDAATVLGPFMTALARNVEAANRGRDRMRLRLSVHGGPIHVHGAAGSPGGHAVQSGRLVGAAPLRAAMGARPEAGLGVIISDRVYEDFVGQGYGGPSREEFRHVHVTAKSQEYQAYVHLPGHNVHRLSELDEYDVEPGVHGDDEVVREAERGGVTAGRDYYGGGTATAGGNGVAFTAGRDAFFGDDPRDGRRRR